MTSWQAFYRGQVTGAQGLARDADLVRIRLVVVHFQIVGEEKELVLLDWTADIAAKVVVSEMPDGWIEKVAGIEIAVSGEFVSSAVVAVGAGLEDHVGNSAACPA